VTISTSLRERICEAGSSLFNRRLTPGSSGNISVRSENGWLVTPTNSSLGDLDPASISSISAEGHQLSGKSPSKEWFFHRACYEARASVGAVVHLHSTHAAAVSCLADLDYADCFPPLTAYQVMRLGAVPVVPFFRPGDEALGPAVGSLVKRHTAVLLANHGPVVVGKTLDAALNAAEELEETATLYLMLRAHKLRLLTEAQIADLHRHFPIERDAATPC
jgi:ribulose-5-phosphate 4-epimerase/fuculose-1-phosphate aldolase